jgi:hypothetical protein
MVARAVALWRQADKKPADRVAHLLGSLSSGIPDLALACVSEANDQRVTRDIPYATAHERQILDIYADIGMIVGGNFLRVMKAVLPA